MNDEDRDRKRIIGYVLMVPFGLIVLYLMGGFVQGLVVAFEQDSPLFWVTISALLFTLGLFLVFPDPSKRKSFEPD